MWELRSSNRIIAGRCKKTITAQEYHPGFEISCYIDSPRDVAQSGSAPEWGWTPSLKRPDSRTAFAMSLVLAVANAPASHQGVPGPRDPFDIVV